MYRKGYFMSAYEEKQARAILLLDYKEAKVRLATLKIQADKLAGSLELIARNVRNVPEIPVNCSILREEFVDLNISIEKVIHDILETDAEVTKLHAQVTSVGLGHLMDRN